MIDALIAGKIYGAPVARMSKAGKPFCTGKLRAAAGNGESVFVGLVAFSDSAIAALLALGDGDGCSVAGTLTACAYLHKDGQPRASLDMVVSQVLSPYHVGRKRKAMQEPASPEPSEEPPAPPVSQPDGELNDPVPF